MANALGEDIEGKIVVFHKKYFKENTGFDKPFRRVYYVSGGFGSKHFTIGKALFGNFVFDGEKCRMEGYMVERYATKDEIAEAKKYHEDHPEENVGDILLPFFNQKLK